MEIAPFKTFGWNSSILFGMFVFFIGDISIPLKSFPNDLDVIPPPDKAFVHISQDNTKDLLQELQIQVNSDVMLNKVKIGGLKAQIEGLGNQITTLNRSLENLKKPWWNFILESLINVVVPLASVLAIIITGLFAAWYTWDLKKADMTLQMFHYFLQLDSPNSPGQESKIMNNFYWWSLQHLQFTFWRKAMIPNTTFHSWMVRRRMEHWQEIRQQMGGGKKFTGLRGWEDEKDKFAITDFYAFMEKILPPVGPYQSSIYLNDKLELKNEGEEVERIMREFFTPRNKIFCIFEKIFTWIKIFIGFKCRLFSKIISPPNFGFPNDAESKIIEENGLVKVRTN